MTKALGAGVALAVVGIVLIMVVPCHADSYDASVWWAVVLYVVGAITILVAAALEPVSWGGRVLGVVLAALVLAGAGFFFGIVGTFRCWTF